MIQNQNVEQIYKKQLFKGKIFHFYVMDVQNGELSTEVL